MAGDLTDHANGKRKRDESHERRAPSAKERRTKVRQEHMEGEFAATYHGLTALYKLLEVKHLQSPLFLPRTLSYRLDPAWKQERGADEVKGEGKAAVRKDPAKTAAAGATMKEFTIGMTSDTMAAFKSANQRVGLLLSVYTAMGKSFGENQFSLLATCLIPGNLLLLSCVVPCSKEVSLPSEFLRPEADICVVAFQVVEISDVGESLTLQPAFSFAAAGENVSTVSGKDLLTTPIHARAPLFGSLLRLSVTRRRMGYFTVELPAIASSVQGGEWRGVYTGSFKVFGRLARICDAKLKVDAEGVKDEGSFTLAIPKRDIPSGPARKPCSGVRAVLALWTFVHPHDGVVGFQLIERRALSCQMCNAMQIWFHFLYHSMMRRMSEKRFEYSCAWCNMFAGSLRGLVAHLVSSHDRFRFQATIGHDDIPHIYVMVMQANAPQELVDGRRSALSELELHPDGELNRFEHHFSHLSAVKFGPHGSHAVEAIEGVMQDFDDLDAVPENPQEFYAPLLQRQYFHSRTGAVVLDHEKDYDSDDDVDETWITKQSERLLDEFEDVSLEEKEFMKKWNRHVNEFRYAPTAAVAFVCVKCE
ncbi:hypothetical protein BBJ28_00022307 [Nothophytophthora sp. Chile5]|nr:hypothetical protein BBJ28_00022307 [Nothophytophthora sp. Chile5]